jgi:para-aminobenzoate synthetase component 1
MDAWNHLDAAAQLTHNDSSQTPAARWVGYLSYELGASLEDISTHERVSSAPDLYLARYAASITVDMKTKEVTITGDSEKNIENLVTQLRNSGTEQQSRYVPAPPPKNVWTYDQFEAAVHRAKEYISAGDVYQVNLSHRFESMLHDSKLKTAMNLYLRLRNKHEAPYGAFLHLAHTNKPISIASNSPEGFLEVDLRGRKPRIATWPLKGTRPSSGCENELRASEKDRAEHVMIVDLERNDFGRIAKTGTVSVSKLMDVVRLPTVLHLESRVEATPLDGLSLTDIFRACFPGGSITGAPKVRSMQVISELEGERRGVYCGAMGYIDFDGLRSRWSIPIRTALFEDQRISFRSGSGIVADSDTKAEWQETLDKAVAIMAAISEE